MNSSAIIIFVKSPIPGNVKTRLVSSLGPVHATNLYKCFIKDIIQTARLSKFHLKIFYHPPDTNEIIRQILGDALDYQSQTGKDLGEKMANAFFKVFNEKFQHAVLIGSDIPDLPKDFIVEAMTELSRHDAVIGPSHDGGYYLIGFRSDTFTADIFKDIAWSTESVYAKTIRKFARHKLKTHIMPQWRDVDTYEDFLNLKDALLKQRSIAEETHTYLIEVMEKNG